MDINRHKLTDIDKNRQKQIATDRNAHKQYKKKTLTDRNKQKLTADMKVLAGFVIRLREVW